MTTSTAEKNTTKPAAKPATKGPGRPSADPAADAVDLSSLTFAVAEKPKRKGAGDNPFTDVLGESYETETARATTVPAVALKRVEGLLRRAAGDLKIGVSIAATEPDSDGKVTVTFMGKDRRKVKGKGDAATTETAPTETNTTEAGDAATDVPASVPGAAESEPTPA